MNSLGMYMSFVALGWLVLEMTDSPLSLGLVWATRSSPNLLFGIMAGTIADRFDRRKILIMALITLAALAFLMGLLSTRQDIELWQILGITFLMGMVSVVVFPARQSLVVDIVGREGAMNAISINSVGMRIIGIFGGAAGGFIIEYFGVKWAFFMMTAGYLFGASCYLMVRGVEKLGSEEGRGRSSAWKNFTDGLKLIGLNRIVLNILIITAVCEILGFSWMVLLPVFARDILQVGAVGLGVFYSVLSVGGLIGALSLASLGDFRYKGRLILNVFLTFGVGLILFSQSHWYAASLIVVAVLGAASACMDTMGHTILQLNVPAEQRGRAMGIWMTSIGFGLLGYLAVGALATATSPSFTLTLNGSAIILAFIIFMIFAPQLRRI